jgi:histidinol-phosphate aminotransferase
MSLAGLRLGFIIACEPLVEALFTVKDSFNSYPVDSLTQLLGEIALSDESYYKDMRQKIIATRERFCEALREMGWFVLPSKTNFVFATKKGVSGRQVYEVLKGKGILVRHFNIEGIQDFVRITIGRDEDMTTLLDEIKGSF